MEILSSRKNCMGTMSFTLKIGKMRKAEEFITYPIQMDNDGKELWLQSSHRWAALNTESGQIVMSARRAQYANNAWLMTCILRGTAEYDQAERGQLNEILTAVRGTSGDMVGNNVLNIYCDNSNASLV